MQYQRKVLQLCCAAMPHIVDELVTWQHMCQLAEAFSKVSGEHGHMAKFAGKVDVSEKKLEVNEEVLIRKWQESDNEGLLEYEEEQAI